jgi:hypothetical protein
MAGQAGSLAGRVGAGVNHLTLRAFIQGQSWLASGSRLANLALVGGAGLNAIDEGTLLLMALLGDCYAAGELQALQQLGAADGWLPFGLRW